MSVLTRVLACGLLYLAGQVQADAAAISRFSPQGEVAQVRQVRASFSESAIQFGDPKAPAPFDVNCSEAGTARWADDKNWIFDFVRDLPPGTKCSFSLKSGFKTLAGNAISGKTAFQFNTGGPAVVNIQPYQGEGIDEDQAFILTQNGAATEASIREHLYCEIEGVHERVPVKFVAADMRAALLKQFAQKIEASRVTIVQCQQRFPNEAAVRLVWDKGIATPSGIATTQAQSFKFKTRKAFTASFTCQRENANSACTPILPVNLYFSSPITRKLAEDIVLKGARGNVKPDFAKDNKEEMVSNVSFKPPLAEKAEYSIVLPNGLKDENGRTLSNAAQFPLKFTTADFPPLAKFPSAPFGIIELNADATLPVTLRNVENSMVVRSANGKASPGKLADVKVDSDAGIIAWMGKLNRYHESTVQIGGKPVETRSIGLLEKEPGARKLDLPPSSDAPGAALRPFEVIGIPFKEPGFHVVELESRRLGAALLDKPVPMFVRTSVLVTNLAVHLKLGRENAAVWVTTLDNAKPVADADVRISDCKGKELWRGRTDKNGIALSPKPIEDSCVDGDSGEGRISGLFASARKTDEKGRADMAFALSSWNSGIESFRFNLPLDFNKSSTVRAHTILDRSLLRAGETVSMKHVIRIENMRGFGLQKKDLLPDRVRIIHQGSNQEFQFPLVWRGQNTAETVFAIPKQAKLGRYDILLDKGQANASPGTDTNAEASADDQGEERDNENTLMSGSFRVEEFRLPLLQGRITPPKTAQISPKELPLDVQLNYLNGGGASGLSAEVTSLLRNRAISFPAYQEFSFASSGEYDEEQKIVANKLPVTLDKNGSGKTVIKDLPAIKKPQELLSEMTYADPNGEVQTVSAVTPLWPSGLVIGVKAGEWVSVKKKMTLTAIVLDTNGKPQADVKVDFSGIAKQTNSHRKRMVGGFYAYENAEDTKDLGSLCSGKSDARGLVLCDVELSDPGNIEVFARAKDGSGNLSQARTSVWVTRQGEIWFDGENQDRIDILPEKKRYQAGETAKFQVRMPFRFATALVAVEREGIIDTMVVQLNGQDPTINLPIKAEYGPNVFVSVLAVRGRMREVPWYSFFTWGWKEPLNWWHEFREYQAPGAIVDLSKPAYKYGIAEISVGTQGNQLGVTVTSDKSSYPIRSTAKVSFQVLLPSGKPAAGAEVAVAAVDEALLELQPNTSWDLLAAMIQRRSYGIETSTAQMQVIGKRHYGRKAVAAGGGGGKSPTRELFDTLLLWRPNVVLDANGRAQLDVPLNDALTSFKIVAVAQSGESLFGTGSTSIRSTQDLQLISGLPPLVREGDRFNAMLTVRNTTTRAMQVDVAAKVGGLGAELNDQKLSIPAGEARELSWSVTAPVSANGDAQQLAWEVKAQEQGGQAVKDSLKFSQRVVPAVPVTVQQASLFQLDKATSIAVSQPADGLPGRGGLAISLMPSLAGPSEGLRRFFADYPYSCLEQKTSKAIGLRDAAMWERVMTELPTYLDDDGLAYYYPPNDASKRLGSDTLTAYILAASNEASYALPQQSRDKMLRGLAAFVDGKITRDFWSPKKDLDVRKIAALEALSRYGQMDPRMLGSIQIAPNQWPTSTLLDWTAILQRVGTIPQHDKYLKEVDQVLRSRLNYQGTRMGFSTESDDYWWWLMWNGDANANRLILVALNDPAWREDMPKLINGAIQRQQRGRWASTTANVWGTLALEKFAQKFETEKVSGTTKAALAAASQSFNWPASGGGKLSLPWPAGAVKAAPAASAAPSPATAPDGLKLTHDGRGKPWVTLQSLAAVALKAPFSSGYRITKTLVPVEQKEKGKYSRGDVVRVELEVDAQTDMTWVVVSDPVPAGASLLGSGLGRDSAIASSGERSAGSAWPAYEERSFEAYRSYYQFVPKGKFKLSYTMRLNNAGEFNLPQTRVEAMYASEMFGEIPNAPLNVK
ncbi:Ig-like domain-containing alpha-2-macroglobulin family protein [Undibacterium terreum]|uniref:Alpha-2-macroglobulin n=1 Tax=Undibacterium terreum TaxID=1224302 RepID=A0A916UXJ3_9BURK|nr:Ig-like domain-containing alpha-2-macroglobulin family protein [Undibacterium terreum]GGC93326.1 alpha-2-macroglobulin [Undibacterium terreum]